MSDFFQLVNLPMPPSSNHQYTARSFQGKHAKAWQGPKNPNFSLAKICPTRDLERFEKDIKERWKNEGDNLVALYKCRSLLRSWMLKGLYIRVETYAFFPYFGLFTKEGMPRKMDGTNRLKALHDCMAELLEVDDSWFWDAEVRKRVDRKDREFCIMRFYPVENVSLQEMKERGIL